MVETKDTGSYNFSEIESKWQKEWEDSKTFEVSTDKKKPKKYLLEMFPYPSGVGLHIGHALCYTIGDIRARFLKMKGFNVLHPMGYDSFGLPAENAAIKAGVHPKDYTNQAIANFIMQQKRLGISYDWSKVLSSCEPEYFKWNQKFFLEFLKRGLAYRKNSNVNWCPKCNTVLANEQVENGRCWRHEDTEVEIKPLEQWFIKTTDYADELLDCVDDLDWPARIKLMQKNWIGKSYGAEIDFEIDGNKWTVFTTRPDTIFGVTFMVVAAQHPRLNELVTDEQRNEVDKFLKKIKSVSEKELADSGLDKQGVFTGSYAVNPATGERVPVYAGNFVVAEYGSGMVMAVPAHDKRDFAFAKKYGIDIKQVVAPSFFDNENPPKKGAKDTKRNIIHAIVLNKKGDKFVALRNKSLPWLTPVTGGVDEGESALDAAIREVKEETGYQNFELFKQMPYQLHAQFYAAHKKVNRSVMSGVFVFKLKDEKKVELDAVEAEKHEVEWLGIEKLGELTPVSELPEILTWFNAGKECHTDKGILINSSEFDGLENEKAKKEIVKWLAKSGKAREAVNYKLRDWLISRQRYWGTPIPVVYCDKCGIVPEKEENLPIELPYDVKFGDGNPLASNEKFVNCKCPECGGDACRETDTMDTFVDSSWYYMRYPDAKNDKEAFGKKNQDYWLPVDSYIGGAEHAVLHLLYARFWTKALRDLGYVNYDEPFTQLFNQGMLHASDGRKMSKSLGNVINPIDIIEREGSDALRMTLMSFASPDSDTNWDEKVLLGTGKFLAKVYSKFANVKVGKSSPKMESKLNKAIKEVSNQFENYKYNLAIIKIRDVLNSLGAEESRDVLEKSLKLLAPVCPHIAEELWSMIKGNGMICESEWPKADEAKVSDKFEKEEQAVDKLVADILNVTKLVKEKEGKDIEKVYVYTIPPEKKMYEESLADIEKRVGKKVKVFATNDKEIIDPEGKSKKAKPGKVGLYLE